MNARVKLISKKHVKAFALELAKTRAHEFTRVSGDFCIRCEGVMKEFIRGYIHSLPSVVKTIR